MIHKTNGLPATEGKNPAVRVLVFHKLREHAGTAELQLELTHPLSAESLWDELERISPGIGRYQASTRIARNQSYVADDALFYPGDELALIPPVSGG